MLTCIQYYLSRLVIAIYSEACIDIRSTHVYNYIGLPHLVVTDISVLFYSYAISFSASSILRTRSG